MKRALALVVATLSGIHLHGCSSDPVASFNPDVTAPSDAGMREAGDAGEASVDAELGPRDIPVIPTPDATQESDEVQVYAHTSNELFTVDPRTFTVTSLGDFGFPADGNNHQMTDIAVTSAGVIWGVTFEALYRVNATNARCTFVSTFAGSRVNGLTFVPAEESGTGVELLIAADRMGVVYRVDTTTGRTSMLGTYGANLISSGDLVSVRGAGTYATVVSGGVEFLARVNPATGRAALIGATGDDATWGLGYWRGRIYGFTEGGNVVTIDLTTGRATPVDAPRREWWGAGVTTLAPTAPQ